MRAELKLARKTLRSLNSPNGSVLNGKLGSSIHVGLKPDPCGFGLCQRTTWVC
jgi:hypothetical protein